MLTIYTNKFIPDKFAACARGPFIFIRLQYKDDEGLLRHEQLHVQQWFTLGLLAIPLYFLLQVFAPLYVAACLFSFSLHGALYTWVAAYRQWAEVQCYKKQALYYADDRRPLFAKFLSEKYNLSITQPEALALLQ